MQEVHDFISTARAAFRRLHGLAPDAPPATFSDAPRAFNAWARKHRLTGLLAINTPDAGETLRTAAYGQAQHSARFAGEAERLYAWLAPRLPALALVKGPALAAQAWPQPGLRSFDDLDSSARGKTIRICWPGCGKRVMPPPRTIRGGWNISGTTAGASPSGIRTDFSSKPTTGSSPRTIPGRGVSAFQGDSALRPNVWTPRPCAPRRRRRP